MAALVPVYLFTGEDRYSKNEAIEKAKKALLPKDGEAFNFFIHDAAQSDDVSALLEYLRSAPFLGNKKLAVLLNTEKVADRGREPLVSYVESPPAWACLILETSRKSLTSEWSRRLAKRVKVVPFERLTGSRLISWISLLNWRQFPMSVTALLAGRVLKMSLKIRSP